MDVVTPMSIYLCYLHVTERLTIITDVMKMNSKVLVLLVTLVIVFSAISIIAFGDDNAAADGDFTIVDDRGVSFTFNSSVDRIASLGKPFTQILFAIGAGDKVVAVDTYSLDFNQTYPVLNSLFVGASIFSLNVENVAIRNPDVVITYNYQSQSVRDRIAAMEALGFPVLAFNPQSYNDVISLTLKLGALSGETQTATLLSNQMNDVRNQITLAVSGLGSAEKPRVYFELRTYGEPAANIGSVSHSLIEMAGGINVAFNAALGSTYKPTTETVLSWNPQIIIVEERHSKTNQEILNLYSNGSVSPSIHRFTDGYNTYDLNLMYGLMEMAELLHPDLFDFS